MVTHAQETRLDAEALARVVAAIEADVEAERYDGAVIVVARGGEIGLHEAIGFADRAAGRPAGKDDVFRLLSVTKAYTTALVLAAIDRGQLTLATKVVDVIPEFRGPDRFRARYKDVLSVAHLLTHRGALAGTPTPVPYEELGDFAKTIAAICDLDLAGTPGEHVAYSPALGYALLGEILRRVTGGGRSIGEIMRQDLFEPLGMTGTSLGAPAAWADRLVPLVALFETGLLTRHDIEVLNTVISEDAEMPWVGAVSSAEDLFRFAEMLRRGGELDGTRILSPAVIELATTNHTGTAPNETFSPLYQAMGWEVPPAYIGLGLTLRGSGLAPSRYGSLTSPRTFGNFGAGSTVFWVDPARDLTFVCLAAGVMEEPASILRFQRLSDMAVAAAVS